jgi:hypothetical protein
VPTPSQFVAQDTETMHDLTVHWGWLVGAAIVGLVAGFVLALRAAASAVKPVNDRLLRDSATDRNLLLNVLRRELANWMIRRNPDRYLLVYGKAHTIAAAVSNCTSNERQLRLSLLCIKYPIYQEFDLLSTREHVLYSDAFAGRSYDDVQEHYINIVEFQALLIASGDPFWSGEAATSDDDLMHLKDYVRKVKDTRFHDRLNRAIIEYDNHCYNLWSEEGRKSGEALYETDAFRVWQVSHFAETRYGVHFKDTNEFGLYGRFHGDRDEPYTSFYRSDRRFQEEIILDNLHMDELI